MIIALGEILVDRIANEISNDVAAIQDWTDFPGGAPANVACALQRLGTKSLFLGAVGNDAVGDRLLSILKNYDVNLDLVKRCNAPTRQVYVTRNEQGDRQFAGFGNLPNSAFADTQLQYQSQDQDHFSPGKFLYVGSLMLAEDNCRAAVDQYLNLAQRKNIPCFMDINWRPMFWDDPDQAKGIILERLSQVSFLKLSEEEAVWLFASQSPETIRDRCPHLQGIFVTGGAKGCDYLLYDFAGTVPGFDVDAIDTTGAGDGFVAGCLHQLASGTAIQTAADAEQFVRYANAVGAMTTMQLGAIAPHPTANDVLQFLEQPFKERHHSS